VTTDLTRYVTELTNSWQVERSGWPSGPWDTEPDFAVIEHAGFTGFVKRAWTGGLCGYVALPPNHPWHGKDYSDVSADCHGQLTFAERMGPYWCLGFDCGHAGDVTPMMVALMPGMCRADWVYRDFAYVREQVKGLCQQAADVMRALP